MVITRKDSDREHKPETLDAQRSGRGDTSSRGGESARSKTSSRGGESARSKTSGRGDTSSRGGESARSKTSSRGDSARTLSSKGDSGRWTGARDRGSVGSLDSKSISLRPETQEYWSIESALWRVQQDPRSFTRFDRLGSTGSASTRCEDVGLCPVRLHAKNTTEEFAEKWERIPTFR